ncbi:MAG: hypothetical protein K5907_02455, partial [Treponema sp.]|nr:hypothetical protein [Treponema sp.]
IDNKNYYSDASTVKYEIVDKMSGIKNKGTGNVAYPGFENRETEFAKEQGENIKNLEIDGSTIYIKDVEDYAGNKAGAVGLSYEGSTEWVYQPNAPAFASSSPVQITAVNPPSGKRFETGASSGEWYIDSSRKITHIQLKMTMVDSEPLLGWIIKKDDSVPENKIYTVADTQSQNGNPAVLTPIPHSGKVYTYSIDKTKKSGNQTVDDTNKTWNDYFNQKPLKFYAVNRAGIINPDPIVINFKKLPVPALDGSLEYSDVIKYPSSDSTDNYIKSASKVIFKTTENPDKCTIFVGSDSVTFTLSTYLNDSTGKYEIPLGTNAKLKAASGATLKLVLSITDGEDSDAIELKGPANTNKWTFDETPPSISVASVKTQKQSGNTDALSNKFDSNDKTYYIEGDNAVITFATNATDIAKWQKKLSTDGDSAYADMTLSNEKTITLAPDKTYNFRAIDKAGNVSTVQTVALKKDVSAPAGNVTYKLKNDNNDAETGSYTDDNNGTIVYNTSKVNKLYINLTNVNDPDGNGLHFYSNGTEITPTEEVNDGVKVKYYVISLSSTNASTATYAITVKDNVGKETTLKPFIVTADGSAPDISLADNPVNGYKSGSGSNIKYYVSEATTYITFATPTATDVKGYKVSTDGTNYSDELISIDENRRYAVTTPDNQKYYFKSVDNVGHESSSAVSVTVVKDATAPSITEGSELTFTAQTESGTAVLVNNSVGDYKVSEENNVITIVYNSSVKTITFDPTCMQDTGSGFKAFYYKSASGNPHDMTDNKITLDATWSNKEYGLYAEDNAGNAALIKTLNFTADSTGPEITSGVTTVSWHDRNVKQVNGYTSTMGLIPYAKWVPRDDRQRASYYTSGTKLMFAKTAISGAIQYQMVQTVTTGNTKTTDGYTATAGNTWQNMVVSDDGNSFVFALPDIHTPYTRLSLFFRDELGNVSDAYYLGNNNENQHGIQWWIIGGAIKAGDTTITSITWKDNEIVKEGWGGKKHDYTVTLTLPVGTLIKSVFLVPKPGNANTGVVFSTSLPQGVNTSLQFSGYGTETDVVEKDGKKFGIKGNYDSEGFLVLPSSSGSTSGTITMIIYPHDVEDADKGNIKVKFNADSIDATNGISGAIFGDSPTFSIVNTGISLLQDIMLAGASEKMEKSVSPSISRIQNYWSPVTYNTQASVNFIEENNPIKAAQTIAETVAAKQTAKQKTETSAKPKAKTKAKTKTKAKAKAEAKAEELVQTMPEMVQDVIEQIEEITPDAGINAVEPAAITAVQGNSELKTTEATTTEPSTKSTTTIILVILALCIAITGIVVGCKKRKILV